MTGTVAMQYFHGLYPSHVAEEPSAIPPPNETAPIFGTKTRKKKQGVLDECPIHVNIMCNDMVDNQNKADARYILWLSLVH